MPRPRLPRPALTKRSIDAARPAATDRFLWDGSEHGLGIKITPAGSKVFVLQKSVRGRPRRLTLGRYGDLTLEQARRQARHLNGQIAMGRDPMEDARRERADRKREEALSVTMNGLWRRYQDDVILPTNKPATAAKKSRMWHSRVAPALGEVQVRAVTDIEVQKVIRSPMRADAGGRVIGGKAEAANLYRLLHHMFRKALAWGIRPRELGSPLEDMAEPSVPRRERLLSEGEVAALLAELQRSARKRLEAPQVTGVVRAAILTGARISELLNLRWSDVREKEQEMHLPDTKTGFSRRPISGAALEVFRSMGRSPDSDFVFRGVKDQSRPLSYETVEKAFRRLTGRAGMSGCSLHTIRHWFSTMTANSVSNPRVGMALTGHRSHAAYLHYVHGDCDQARTLADHLGRVTAALAAKAGD